MFAIKIMIKEYLREDLEDDEKLYAAFMDLEKAYVRV